MGHLLRKGMNVKNFQFISFDEASRNLDGLQLITDRYQIHDTLWMPSLWTRAYDAARRAINREFTSELYCKLSVMAHAKGDESIITIVRLDNMTEEEHLDSVYKPIDKLWRGVVGWSSELKLCFDTFKECLAIPPNPLSNTLQFSVSTLNAPEHVVEKEIPRQIFFTWNSNRFEECPVVLLKTMDIVKLMNPSYKVHYFSPEDARNFIAEHESANVLSAYDLLAPRAFQVDFWRYVVLYHQGGVYLDVKITTVYPLDSFLPVTGGLLVNDIRGAGLLNGILAMPRHSRLMRLAIDGIVQNVESRFYGQSPLDISGPNHLFRCFNELSPAEQSQFKRIKFHLSGILAHDGDLPVFSVHNGEYRRILSRPGMANHYEELWVNRTVYGEPVLVKEADIGPQYGMYLFVSVSIILMAAIYSIKHRVTKIQVE